METTQPEFVFEPAIPGSWTVVDRAASSHEAQHAVAAVLLEVEVLEVRIDRPGTDGRTWGHCVTRKHAENLRNAAVSIAPLAVAGTAGKCLDLLSDDGDVWQAAMYYMNAGEPADAWAPFVAGVRSMLISPGARRAITAVARELLQHGAFTGDRVAVIVEDAGRP